jgi:hypothetical protein
LAIDPEPAPVDSAELLERITAQVPAAEHVEPEPQGALFAAEETAAKLAGILAEMAAEPDCTFQGAPALFQDFTLRCRMARIAGHGMDVAQFRRRFALAVAGCVPEEPGWAQILAIAAAQAGEPCPEDSELARIYGTSSAGRVRRLLEHYEKAGLIVVRTDFGGRRSIGIPALGVSTAPLEQA